jgi:hypothetical protein
MASLQWSLHPILTVPSNEEQIALGPERLIDFWERREAAITREREDPYNFGTELPQWELVDEQLKTHSLVLLLGGNRSSKTNLAAKRVVQSLVANPGTIIWCFTATSQNSIAHQQAAVYDYLPNEYKTLGHTRVASLRYSVKNGFTNQAFVLPNRSQCVFRNWSQDISTIEGGEVGVPGEAAPGTHNIGIWADEEIPLSWVSTCLFRCLTRADSDGIAARTLLTFTTVSGWTQTVSAYLSGARTLIDKEAELLDGERVPILQQPVRQNARVVYFHTADNPYGGWEAMKNQLRGARRDEILCRSYGVPTKPSNTVFRNLDDRVIMKHDEIPVIEDPEKNPSLKIISIDPAGNKSWFILKILVSANGVHYVVDEWPGVDIGEWADLERGAKGVPGDGAAPNGFGIRDYADQIREMMGDDENCEIICDPRLGNATYSKSEGTSSIIAELQNEGIHVYPAEGLPIDDGLQAINTLLSYDKTQPISFDNHPKLIFSDRVGNTLFCCMNYKVEDGPKGVCKDPVDCLRMVAIGNYQYYGEDELIGSPTGGY